MLEHSLRQWNPWWTEKEIPESLTGIKRDITEEILKSLSIPHIKDVVGVRRSGKTTILYQVASSLIEGGTPPKNIFFINFDDPSINAASFEELQKEIFKINPEISHVFLDEIQQKKGWERWVRTLYDTRKFTQIFVSGSSASLLSRDIGRVLTGRHITFDVMPFSFKEYLQKRGWESFEADYILYNKDRVLHFLSAYIEEGGFPEVVGRDEFNRKKILTALYNDILARDISSRFTASHEIASKIGLYMLTNSGLEYSDTSISRATGTAVETAEKYITYLKESLLLIGLSFFSYKLKTRFKQNKKIYAVDTGLKNAISSGFTSDKGRLAENAVFMELKRRARDVYYWKNQKGYEVDFVVIKDKNVEALIQVAWDVKNVKTRRREERSLKSAMDVLKLNEGIILTEDTEGIVEHAKGVIRYIPLWKWLLEKSKGREENGHPIPSLDV